MQWIIEPEETITQGTIVYGVDWGRGKDNPLSIVLSNACDFEHDKLGFLIVCALVPAKETILASKEFKAKVENAGEDKKLNGRSWNSLVNFLTDYIHNKSIGRYYFVDCAPVLDVDPFFIDFQQLRSVDISVMEDLEIVAQLDHPFVEQMMMHFTGYTARIPSDRVDAPAEANYIGFLANGYTKKT